MPPAEQVFKLYLLSAGSNLSTSLRSRKIPQCLCNFRRTEPDASASGISELWLRQVSQVFWVSSDSCHQHNGDDNGKKV